MDFHTMKRKELQALCKKHGIPANLKNLEMANKLTSLLKENEKPKTRGRSCLKSSDEIVVVDDSDIENKPQKKVKFSPENELFEYSKTDPREKRRIGRRNPRSRPEDVIKDLNVINVDRFEPSVEIVKNPVRVTRSKVHSSVEDGLVSTMNPPMEKKRGRKEIVESDEVKLPIPTRRLLRNREVVESGVVPIQNPDVKRGRKRGIVKCDEPHSLVVVLSENSGSEEKRPVRTSKRNAKTGNGISEKQGFDVDVLIVEPEKASTRSTRNGKKGKESGLLRGDIDKIEINGGQRITRTRKGVKTGNVKSKINTEAEIEVESEAEVVLQVEEPLKRTCRNNNWRKSVICRVVNEEKVETVKADGPSTKYNRRSKARGRVGFEDEKSDVMDDSVVMSASKSVNLESENREQEMENSVAVEEKLDKKSVQDYVTMGVEDELAPQKTGEKCCSNGSVEREMAKDLNGIDGLFVHLDSAVQQKGTETEKEQSISKCISRTPVVLKEQASIELVDLNGCDEPVTNGSVIAHHSEAYNESGDSNKDDKYFVNIEEHLVETAENDESALDDSSNEEKSLTEMSCEKEIDDIKDYVDTDQASLKEKTVSEDPEANDSGSDHVYQTGMLELRTTEYAEISPIQENLELDTNSRICSEEINEEAVMAIEKDHESSLSIDIEISCHQDTSLEDKDEIEQSIKLNNTTDSKEEKTFSHEIEMAMDKDNKFVHEERFDKQGSQEMVGAKESENEKSIHTLTSGKENIDECSNESHQVIRSNPCEEEEIEVPSHEKLADVEMLSNKEIVGSKESEHERSIHKGNECFLHDIRVQQELSTFKQTHLKDAVDKDFVNMEQNLVKSAESDEAFESKNSEIEIDGIEDCAQASHVVNAEAFELNIENTDRLLDNLGEQDLIELAKIEEGFHLKYHEVAYDHSIDASVFDSATGEISSKCISQEKEHDHARDSIENAAMQEYAEISHVVMEETVTGLCAENEPSTCRLKDAGVTPLKPKIVLQHQEENPDMLEPNLTKHAEFSHGEISRKEDSVGKSNDGKCSQETINEAVVTMGNDTEVKSYIDTVPINSVDSDDERAAKSSGSVNVGISSELNSPLKSRDETEQVNTTHSNEEERFNQEESQEIVGEDENECEEKLQTPAAREEDIIEGSIESEQEYQLNLLFATPFNRENLHKEEENSTRAKMTGVAMPLDETNSKVASIKLSSVKPREIVEPKSNENERSNVKNDITEEGESYGHEEMADADTGEMLSGSTVDDQHIFAKGVTSPSLCGYGKGNLHERSTDGEVNGVGLNERWHEDELKNLFATPVCDNKTVSKDGNMSLGQWETQEMMSDEETFCWESNENWHDEQLQTRFATPIDSSFCHDKEETSLCDKEMADREIEGSNRVKTTEIEEKISEEIMKTASKCVKRVEIMEENKVGVLSPGSLGPHAAFDHGDESTIRNISTSATLEGSLFEVAIYDKDPVKFSNEDDNDVSVEVNNEAVVTNNELEFFESGDNKVVVGPEMEISANFEGTKQQVDEVEISKKTSVEGSLSIVESCDLQEKRDDSYQLQVSPQGFDNQLERDKVVKIDNYSQSRVPDCDDLNVHAQGEVMSEVREDKFNDFQEDKEVEQAPREYNEGLGVDEEEETSEVPYTDFNEFEGVIGNAQGTALPFAEAVEKEKDESIYTNQFVEDEAKNPDDGPKEEMVNIENRIEEPNKPLCDNEISITLDGAVEQAQGTTEDSNDLVSTAGEFNEFNIESHMFSNWEVNLFDEHGDVEDVESKVTQLREEELSVSKRSGLVHDALEEPEVENEDDKPLSGEKCEERSEAIADQSNPFVDLAFEGKANEDVQIGGSAQKENPTAKAKEGTSPYAKKFYSTTMKMKTKKSNLVKGTPNKLFVKADMKENAQSLKREPHTENINAAKSVIKRRALGQL